MQLKTLHVFQRCQRVEKSFIEQPGEGYRYSPERGTPKWVGIPVKTTTKTYFHSTSPAGPQGITSRGTKRLVGYSKGGILRHLSRFYCLKFLNTFAADTAATFQLVGVCNIKLIRLSGEICISRRVCTSPFQFSKRTVKERVAHPLLSDRLGTILPRLTEKSTDML